MSSNKCISKRSTRTLLSEMVGSLWCVILFGAQDTLAKGSRWWNTRFQFLCPWALRPVWWVSQQQIFSFVFFWMAVFRDPTWRRKFLFLATFWMLRDDVFFFICPRGSVSSWCSNWWFPGCWTRNPLTWMLGGSWRLYMTSSAVFILFIGTEERDEERGDAQENWWWSKQVVKYLHFRLSLLSTVFSSSPWLCLLIAKAESRFPLGWRE